MPLSDDADPIALDIREGAPFDCRACGACCVSPWNGHGYALLTADEARRLRAAGVLTVTMRHGGADGAGSLVEKLAMRRDSEGRFVCAELSGRPGGACSCRIYERRPGVCRRLEPGSPDCLEARERLGMPVAGDP